MKNFRQLLGTSALVLALQSCNRDETYELEYTNIVHEDAVVSKSTIRRPHRRIFFSSPNYTLSVRSFYTRPQENVSLYDQFTVGQHVDLVYRGVFGAAYKEVDGKKTLVSKTWLRVEFIDAQPK